MYEIGSGCGIYLYLPKQKQNMIIHNTIMANAHAVMQALKHWKDLHDLSPFYNYFLFKAHNFGPLVGTANTCAISWII